ncbi:dipeptidase [Lignipirellula cremea]|uniref:Membrane dipeptidase (Peptidase family M19) n=1 Tax=Lignipirellula cremea TaxID=2528010 RepID=A0A518E2G3_9BACT|nr:membrane dipeptidase [Lignipirellula cremea]QDU98281.1 Membrane dipeptidase (Peptidase family M19) [Lignipirellula cremea]
MLIFDGHLDLSMNALEWNRDLRRPLEEIRSRESHMTDRAGRGQGVVSFPEMRRGGIGLCIATQIGHSVSKDSPKPGWSSPEIAWSMTQGQLAYYRAMEEVGEMVQISDRESLQAHVKLWQDTPEEEQEKLAIGYVLSLEGADSILTLDYLHRAYRYGLRAVGPAHYGPGRYAPGTGETGGLEPDGRKLLAEMQSLGMILDATHLTDKGLAEALDIFDGPVWASHSNARALVQHQRQWGDEHIKELAARGAVLGAAFDAWMLIPNWKRFVTKPEETNCRLATVVDHIDYICQLLGSTAHSAIGSDLDGGYGREQCPRDLYTISDLSRIAELLAERGYSEADIAGIMHGNWIRFLENAWA